MIEKIRYINHMNECIDFGSNGIYANENDLHSFTWTITSKNDRISDVQKGISKSTLPITIICKSESEGITARNKLFEIAEKDVLALKHGKIVIGDYYLKCYVTAHKVSNYLYNKRFMKVTLTIQTDYPNWVKETTHTFGYGSGTEGKNLDYNNDFDYDYTSNMLGKQLNNTDFVASNFKMRIYGVVVNPSITVGDHVYSANVTIEKNEYLTIDSIEKTVTLVKQDGTEINCFNRRNRESYIFEKIPSGVSNISSSGRFKFDITLLEERGVPKWT